jgi:hypothetical protein
VTLKIRLPDDSGHVAWHEVGSPRSFTRPSEPLESRRVFAAAHVVADPLADNTPGSPAVLDWDATLAFRRHLWSWGMAVADAMDTAQRGMGLDWTATRELIVRSAAEARAEGGDVGFGASTDQLPAGPAGLDDIADAYAEQVGLIEEHGGQAVIMGSRHLTRAASHAEDYLETYRRVIEQASRPVIIHWLGGMFDPALTGYWGSEDLDEASDTFLTMVEANSARIDGVKISLLDAGRERLLRRGLPPGVRMYTGDDFNYPELIRGDDDGSHSDALLGAFDIIAPAASAAIQALDAGSTEQYDEILAPTLPLARHVFGHPTSSYKTGVVFMAYLNGHQDHFRMVAGQESARSVPHLARVFRLADQAGLLVDPERAVQRMERLLAMAGL